MTISAISGAGRRNQVARFQKSGLLQRGLLAGGIAFTSLLAGPALADTAFAEVDWVNHPSIIVESNGHDYTKVKNSSHSIEGKINIRADAELNGRVESWSAWPVLIRSNPESGWISGHSGSFKDSGSSKSYSSPRPKDVSESFNFSIPRQDYADLIVYACNEHRDYLRGQSKTYDYIFSENRVIKVYIDADMDVEFTGPDRLNPLAQEISEPPSFNVVCERDVSKDPVALDPDPTPIKDSHLVAHAVKVNKHTGECELQVSGTIVTEEPNVQVKFRYYSDKGQQSDLKTITTDGSGFKNFLHIYPLEKGGTQSGKVQMIGTSHAFMSNWADFEADCSAPPQDVATLLPPKATHLEAIATAENVMHRGLICPAKVKIWGIIEGRGEVAGNVALAVGGKLNALEPYSIKDGQTVVVQGEHELKWDNLQSAQQNVQYAMYVLNKNGDQVDQMQATHNFVCKEPQVSGAVQGGPQGIASNDNLPKSVTLSLSTLGQKKIPGYVCPEKVRLHGNVMSDDQPLTGLAILYADDTFLKEHDVDLQANWGHNYDAEHTFVWNAATQTEQTMSFTLKFANQHGHIVKTVEKSESFACQKVSVNPAVAGGPGGIATEQNDPLPAQQQRPQAATGQLAVAPALAVMAPKGTVRNGEIRLSGAKPNAAYKLTFLRRSGSGYTAVNAAQLPKQMKGPNASFPLAALSGGRAWRLQVCPLGAAPSACETSDFRVALIGAKTDGQPGGGEPGGSQPTPTFIVVPGLTN